MSERLLRKVEKAAEVALKKQTQEGLAKIFTMLSCKGVAKEIKAGRNVSGNVEFGIRHCVHPKIGPRVNVKTWKFTRMTPKAKRIEKNFLKYANKMLTSAGFREVSPKLLTKLSQGDKAFERKIKTRRKKK